MTLDREGLIAKMRERGWYKNTMRKALDDIIEIMAETIASGDTVKLRRFGEFGYRDRPPHRLRSVVTGEIVMSRGSPLFFYKPSMLIRNAVREGNVEFLDRKKYNEYVNSCKLEREKAQENKYIKSNE